MLGTSFPELVLIRICIILLQYTTPICLACFALLAATTGSINAAAHHPIGTALLGYSALDALYALFIYRPYTRRLRQEAKHPPPLTRSARRALFQRTMAQVTDARSYLQGWFMGASEDEIRRENVRDFLMWAFFDQRPGAESAEESAELDEYLSSVEERLGYALKPGRGSAQSLRLTFDDVETRYRSVIWYVIVGLVDLVTDGLLVWCGFAYHAPPRKSALECFPPRVQGLVARKRSVAPQMGYWYRPHTAGGQALPVVFLHGIGIGLSTYVPYLAGLNPERDSRGPGAGQIGIIALENLPISFRLTADEPLRKAEFLGQVAAILDAHGWSRVVLVAHSYGTVLATHMLQSPALSPRIDATVLVDPVSLLLHLPDVAYNFTRRRPKRANEWQLWYFASMDPGVAHCLGRHFFWKDNIAWKDDLTCVVGDNRSNRPEEGVGDGRIRTRRVAISLSERDLIVDTLAVAQYLDGTNEWMSSDRVDTQGTLRDRAGRGVGGNQGHQTGDGIELFWFPGLDHAQVFDHKETRERLCSVTRRYCTT
ncbi:hypothetical protein F4780DRAFT_86144 [Xylariomycetidae sp. FL0641]|nr:hypothetical protein F4780DRAFT_86144 [Xylariomycetidae sp. FL0641]